MVFVLARALEYKGNRMIWVVGFQRIIRTYLSDGGPDNRKGVGLPLHGGRKSSMKGETASSLPGFWPTAPFELLRFWLFPLRTACASS